MSESTLINLKQFVKLIIRALVSSFQKCTSVLLESQGIPKHTEINPKYDKIVEIYFIFLTNIVQLILYPNSNSNQKYTQSHNQKYTQSHNQKS